MKKVTLNAGKAREERLVYSSSLAVSITALVGLSMTSVNSQALELARLFFVASIPFLGLNVLILTRELEFNYKYSIGTWYRVLAQGLGTLMTFLGFVSLVWSMSKSLGIFFAILCISCFLFSIMFDRTISKENNKI